MLEVFLGEEERIVFSSADDREKVLQKYKSVFVLGKFSTVGKVDPQPTTLDDSVEEV